MRRIIENSAEKLGIALSADGVAEIARRSRKTPRTANYILKRVRDYAQVHDVDTVDQDTVVRALQMIGIDDAGLTASDRKILHTLIFNFGGGPVGLKTLAAATGEEESTLEEVIEPYLIQSGFIEKTPRGRVATERAKEHIGK
jgi:Holliday junction DNA helicase RuvB